MGLCEDKRWSLSVQAALAESHRRAAGTADGGRRGLLTVSELEV